jgi:hypothetical protein
LSCIASIEAGRTADWSSSAWPITISKADQLRDGRPDVKIRQGPAENFNTHTQRAVPRICCPSSESSELANPDNHRMNLPVEADRLRLIEQRLQTNFYEVPPAAELIAESVLADLKDPEGSAPALPH